MLQEDQRLFFVRAGKAGVAGTTVCSGGGLLSIAAPLFFFQPFRTSQMPSHVIKKNPT
jgi:hypothetical protein